MRPANSVWHTLSFLRSRTQRKTSARLLSCHVEAQGFTNRPCTELADPVCRRWPLPSTDAPSNEDSCRHLLPAGATCLKQAVSDAKKGSRAWTSTWYWHSLSCSLSYSSSQTWTIGRHRGLAAPLVSICSVQAASCKPSGPTRRMGAPPSATLE